MEFQDRVAVITGAGGGIGAATAQVLASRGATVVVSDVNAELGEATAKKVIDSGGNAVFIQCNIANYDSIQNLFATVIEKYGKVDFLVCNAGLFSNVTTEDMKPEQFEYTVRVNLMGTYYCCQRAILDMRKRCFGKIVILSSQAAYTGGTWVGADYASSKAGNRCLVKTLTTENGKYNININAIAPGPVDTAMHKDTDKEAVAQTIPLRRFGKPEDIAWPIRFLCSEEASWISGATLDVTGGLYMR